MASFLQHPAVKQLIDSIDQAASDDVILHYNDGTYDGYGPYDYEQNTGILRIEAEYKKNQDDKLVRTISVSFSAVVGEVKNFGGVPFKVEITNLK